MSDRVERVLLRADVRAIDGDGWVVAHTAEISPREAFIVTDAPFASGDSLEVVLSLPLAGRAEARATVRERRAGGVFVDLEPVDGEHARRLAKLLEGEPARTPPTYRILLVEDDTLIRDMFAYGVRKYFETHGAHANVDVTDDGLMAWEMICTNPYDIALVDHYLPGMHGSELVDRLRAHPAYRALPVIAMSVGGDDAREAFRAAGADVFLDKPLALGDLFETLGRVTERVA